MPASMFSSAVAAWAATLRYARGMTPEMLQRVRNVTTMSPHRHPADAKTGIK
jgi:hypothetical protein